MHHTVTQATYQLNYYKVFPLRIETTRLFIVNFLKQYSYQNKQCVLCVFVWLLCTKIVTLKKVLHNQHSVFL